jgi:hypothetical protein
MNAARNNSNSNNSGSGQREPFLSIFDRILRNTANPSAGGSNAPSNNIPTQGARTRSTRRSQREVGSNFNSIECRESIRQNLSTLDNLIECSNHYSDIKPNETVELFNFNRRKYIKGQWVDVKDTIDQWLEAQIIDIREDKVYIHYNGWGNRWDEWIDVNSPRIRPFRYHTRQTASNHQSPFPNHKPDADVNLQSNFQGEFLDIFEDVRKSFNVTTDLMRSINEDRRIVNSSNDQATKYNLQKSIFYKAKNLVPFIDRVGRLMSDMGTYINFTLKNNKLEEYIFNKISLDKKAFSEDLDDLLKTTDTYLGEDPDRTRGVNNDQNAKCVNKIDKLILNQIPALETNSGVQTASPFLDVYIHTFVSPIDRQRNPSSNSVTGQNNSEGVPNNNSSDSSNPLSSFLPNGFNFNIPFMPVQTNPNSNNQRTTDLLNNLNENINNIQAGGSNNNNPESLLGRKRESDGEILDMPRQDRHDPNRQSENNVNDVSSFDMVIEEYVEDDDENISNTESEQE